MVYMIWPWKCNCSKMQQTILNDTLKDIVNVKQAPEVILYFIILCHLALDYFSICYMWFLQDYCPVPGHVYSCAYLILLVLPLLFQVELSTL